MPFTRRQLLSAAGALTLPAVLASCGFAPASSPSSSSSGGTTTLSFTTWGTDSELTGFKQAISSFQSSHPGVQVAMNAVPYAQMFTNIDAQIQAGNPPDIFRVPYYTFGAYAGKGQLLDLTSHLPSGFSDRFTPQAWAAVQNGGKPFGVPHHTDTSAILYNKAMLTAAGITSVPTSADTAWTWDQFNAINAKLRASLPASKYPFGYNWQGNGVTRWLNLLFQADGRFLTEDLSKSAIDSAAGRAAVDFSRSFFSSKFVPANDSVKATTLAADTWYAQTTAMVFSGAFAIPDATKTLKFEWGATFPPRKTRSGGDFGGNALVATAAAAPRADMVAAFFDHVTQADQMRAFCAGASLLPTRADLVSGGIQFAIRPELAPVFVQQAAQVKAVDSAQVASPKMAAIIKVLKDDLENGFIGGKTTDQTIAALSTGITAAVSG